MTIQRWQRSRAKGARQPENCRYCGRGTVYGNDYVVVKVKGGFKVRNYFSLFAEPTVYTTRYDANKRAVDLHAQEFEKRTLHDRGLIARVKKDLGRYKFLSCFCPLTLPCHVDFLIKIVNRPEVFLT